MDNEKELTHLRRIIAEQNARFPNGFKLWAETHYRVTVALHTLCPEKAEGHLIKAAVIITDEFEASYPREKHLPNIIDGFAAKRINEMDLQKTEF